MERFLQVGDRFCLKQGMRVETLVPEPYCSTGNVFTGAKRFHEVCVGIVLKKTKKEIDLALQIIFDDLKKQDSHAKDADIKEYIKGLHFDVRPSEYDTAYLIGQYIVTEAETVMSKPSSGKHEVTDCGHKITAQKITDPKIVVTFYQSGQYTALISPSKIELL